MTLSIVTRPRGSSSSSPAVQLTVTATNTAPNAVPPNTVLTLTRIHKDGSEHRVITSSQPRVIPTTWVGLDYHAPFGEPVTYRVTAGAASATATGYALSDRPWLISASEPTLSVLPDGVRAITDRAIASRAVELRPIGGRSAFVGDGTADGMTGTLIVRVTDERPLRALLADDGVILINTPGTAEGWALSWHWVKWTTQAWRQVTDHKSAPYSLCSIAWKESADPDVDLVPSWTADAMRDYLIANGKTVADIPSIWATADNLTIDTRI